MQIVREKQGDLLTLKVDGFLDNESSIHFRETIDESIREGWHRILIDLAEVSYLSSAGMGALLASRKQLDALHGLFGIYNPTPPVEQALRQTKILALLLKDPQSISVSTARASMTWQSDMRIFSDGVAGYEIYDQSPGRPCVVETIGRPDGIGSHAFSQDETQRVPFERSSFGIGLGALGADFGMSRNRFGEFLAVSGTVTQTSLSSHGLPDFLMSEEEFVPDVQMLYGLKFTGDFSQLIRFESIQHSQPLKLSGLASQALQLSEARSAGMVIVAECAGLVGTRLRKSPAEPVAVGEGRFEFPEVRNWLSYCAEQIHRRSLVLVVGIAQHADEKSGSSAFRDMLRPMDAAGSLVGHFHAAVFPYRPLKKRTLNLDTLVTDLFSGSTIQDVLHLLNDDRDGIGAGESEFVTGGCWVAPLNANSLREKQD
ncbi:STAS domain-containing protein [Planctomicrobium sp. SH661]|uniref:STAS domain-containing protein n=1 Tax=Planctomicrobium sp. SH661 TaxID=3448124 RepID=UPI003F5C5BB4